MDMELWLRLPTTSGGMAVAWACTVVNTVHAVHRGRKINWWLPLFLVVIHALSLEKFEVHQHGAVLVTGSSRGLGRDIAMHLDQLGFTVFAGVRKLSDADVLGQTCSARMRPILLDVTNASHIEAAVHEISVTSLPLVAVVNNAGIAPSGAVETQGREDVLRMFQVNFHGAWDVTRSFLPLLRQHRGRVVTVGSMWGLFSPPAAGGYAAAKHGLEAMHDALRREQRMIGSGVSVSLVQPGFIRTDIHDEVTDSLRKQRHLGGDKAVYSQLLEHVAAAGCLQLHLFPTPASAVSRAIGHAVASAFPLPRYLVGLDAHVFAAAAWLLPDRLADRVVEAYTSFCNLPAVVTAIGDGTCTTAGD